MPIVYQESSKTSTKLKVFVYGLAVLLAIALVAVIAYSIYRGSILLAEMFILSFALYVLVMQSAAEYTYTLTEDALIIQEKTLGRRKEMVIPYADMDGIYPFKQQFMGPLRFRYKYRKLSSTDPRPVWALAYSITKGTSVTFARVLLKADDAFFAQLENFLPNRVCVTQDQVVHHALIRKDAVKHGEDVEAYYQKCLELWAEAEREAAQKGKRD